MERELILRAFENPDEVRTFDKGRFEVVEIGGMVLGRATYEPGWKWSEHVGKAAGERYCRVGHVGLVLSGTATAAFEDGEVVELTAGSLFAIPPVSHDSWVVGDEPYSSLHFIGAGEYANTPRAAGSDALLRTSLKSQYHAGLAMLAEAIELCPDTLWLDEGPTNAFWQVAYHALFFTHFYLHPNESAFRPWRGHQGDVQHPDGIAGPPDPESPLPLLPRPYTREEVREYCRFLDEEVDGLVEGLDLSSAESGFWWYPIPKFEHQLVNLRHLGHHAGQLADRVRAATGEGVQWVSAGAPGPR